MQFKTVLLQAGKTATGFEIPSEIVEKLGAGKKPPVKVTINGYTYRNTVAVMGGVYMIGVSALHREGAGIKGGDKITVDLELDTEPRIAEVPSDLAKQLKKEPLAKKNFDALSYSKKRAFIIPITDAKTEETRIRKIEKTILTLKQL